MICLRLLALAFLCGMVVLISISYFLGYFERIRKGRAPE